jgi:hypothetical protein
VTQVSAVDRKTNYRKLYFEIIDVLISKTNERFAEITQLTFFSLLDFSKFEQYVNKFPTNSMDSLKDKYGDILILQFYEVNFLLYTHLLNFIKQTFMNFGCISNLLTYQLAYHKLQN